MPSQIDDRQDPRALDGVELADLDRAVPALDAAGEPVDPPRPGYASGYGLGAPVEALELALGAAGPGHDARNEEGRCACRIGACVDSDSVPPALRPTARVGIVRWVIGPIASA